jgi:hypothetical protein
LSAGPRRLGRRRAGGPGRRRAVRPRGVVAQLRDEGAAGFPVCPVRVRGGRSADRCRDGCRPEGGRLGRRRGQGPPRGHALEPHPLLQEHGHRPGTEARLPRPRDDRREAARVADPAADEGPAGDLQTGLLPGAGDGRLGRRRRPRPAGGRLRHGADLLLREHGTRRGRHAAAPAARARRGGRQAAERRPLVCSAGRRGLRRRRRPGPDDRRPADVSDRRGEVGAGREPDPLLREYRQQGETQARGSALPGRGGFSPGPDGDAAGG